MTNLLRDFRYGVRMLVNRPGFAAAAVSVLALGIGANTAIFTIVNAFLFKPLVLDKPDELVGCYSRDVHKGNYRAFSYPNYADLRANNTVFSALAAHNPALVGLGEGDITRRAFGDIVSSNYFATLGIPLYRGRTFTEAEERPGSGIATAILSYSYWKKTGADPAALGKTVRVNGRHFTVVGITPQGFAGTTAMFSPEVYLPLGMYEAVVNDFEGHGRPLDARNNPALIVVGRLRPGLSLNAADSLLAVSANRLAQAYPGENKDQTFLVSRLSRLSVSTNPSNDNSLTVPAVLLTSMAGIVLLIASLNVANMMLARGTARRKEIAIRLALGGKRGDILRQLFAEGLVLALAGGAAGLVLSFWGVSALMASMTRLVPIDLVVSAGPDGRVLAATMGFCILSTLLFGFGPGWRLSRRSILPGLKDGGEGVDAGGRPARLFSRRNMLVVSQIALSLMLLTAAGLFLRSSLAAAQVNPGFRTDSGILAEVDASLAGYGETRGRQIYSQLLERVRSLPGVESAGMAATVPFGMISLGKTVRTANEKPAVGCRFNIVSEDYFRTLGIGLLRGRVFGAGDTGSAARVAILDRTAANRLWPHGDAVGQHIHLVSGDGPGGDVEAEVVGVVSDVREDLFGQDLPPHVYVPFSQQYQSDMNIHIRTAAADPVSQARLTEVVRREIRAVDDRLPVLALTTLRGHMDSSFDLWTVRTGAEMFLIFGCVALLLAMIGLYGVQAYAVALRTREIGIRMALGATAQDSLRMVLRAGLKLTVVGTVAGLVLSLGLGKVLSSLLYHVSGADPVVLAAGPLLLAAISLLACYVPARRASRIDPIRALRHE